MPDDTRGTVGAWLPLPPSAEAPIALRFAGPDAPDYNNLLSCVRCGLCLAVCPTYATDQLEVQSPRGRLALIKAAAEGQLALSDGLRAQLYHCLDCRACETICPSGVKVGELVVAARAQIETARRQPLLKRAILRGLLPYPARLELAAWPLRLYQRFGLQWVVRHTGLLRPFPRRLQLMEALLPWLPSRALRQVLPVVTPAKGEQKYRVGFFLGCVMSLVFAEASRATVRVLARNSCEVVTPQDQKCCGVPHAGEGDTDTLRMLARHNIDLFERYNLDFVVADCAACSAQTKEYAHLLRDDRAYAEKARAFSAKVRDITEFLAALPFQEPRGKVSHKVTYHEPCHLAHAQGVRRQPREVLRRIPGLELIEMKESDWCCGSAGVYNITHPERGEEILARKLAHAAATGAEVIATGNPGCLLQLEAGVRRAGMKAQVLHPVQLLDEAYRAEGGTG